MPRYSLGFDFGTESVRVLVVDIANGHIAGQSSHNYAHGVIDQTLPTNGAKLPPDYALQHPWDWLESLAAAMSRPGRGASFVATYSANPSFAQLGTETGER